MCMGYAMRITTRAVEVVSGSDSASSLDALASSSAVSTKIGGLRGKWAGGELRARTMSGKMVRQGNGWVLEGGAESPYSPGPGVGGYAGTPVTGGFGPSVGSPYGGGFVPQTPNTGVGLGFPSSTFGPAPGTPRTPSMGLVPPPPQRTPSLGHSHSHSHGATLGTGTGLGFSVPTAATNGGSANGYGGASAPGTPAYAHFPQTPNPDVNGNGHGGFPVGPPPRPVKKDD